MRSSFPPGWAATTIGDVFEIVGGSTPRTDNPDYWDGDIPWLTPDDLSTHQGVPVSRGRRSITDAGFASTSTHMLPKNSILFSSRAPIGYTAVAANPLCTNQGFKSLIPPAGVESRYVYWYLRHATPTIRELGSGTTFRELSKKRMNAVPFVLAPTAEQVRIVAAIEEHFCRLDAVESSLRQALQRLDVLRSAVLIDAFHAHRDLPPAWRASTIGEVADVQLGRQRSPQYHTGEQMRPYLRSANVTWNGISLDDVKAMNFDDADFEKYRLEPGDLLLNEASGSPNEVGKPALWDGEISDCCFQNTLLRLRPHGVTLDYLYWYCYSSALSGRFGEAGRGVNIRHIGKRGLAQFPISLAPRDEQGQIARRINVALEQADASERSIRAAANRTAALRRCVLAEAFAGRLVPQDPQDEPASVLLERITASRSIKPNRQKVSA